MSDRTYKIFMTLIGVVCGYVVIKRFFSPDSLTLRNALIQGFFVGFGLAVVTIEIFARIKIARINGWVTAFGCGLPGNGMFTRAAHTRIFPGPINVPQEGKSAHILFCRDRGMVPHHLFLAAHFAQRIQKSCSHKGFEGPIPINTLATEPQAFFADPLHPPASATKLATTGVNHDTLPTAGVLDLRYGPQVLYVPEMAGRYYSVQFTAPNNTIFAYVGKRTTGTQAGEYLITGPGWKGQVPSGMKQISSPNNSVFVIGRILVYSDSDLPTAYALAKQIQVVPLAMRLEMREEHRGRVLGE